LQAARNTSRAAGQVLGGAFPSGIPASALGCAEDWWAEQGVCIGWFMRRLNELSLSSLTCTVYALIRCATGTSP
jgi:hypothetical protein